MGLNVYLEDNVDSTCICVCDRCGSKHPSAEKKTLYTDTLPTSLAVMTGDCGIYFELWRPETLGIKRAHDMIATLVEGIRRLTADAGHYERYEMPGHWGTRAMLVEFLEDYLDACQKFPDAIVRVD